MGDPSPATGNPFTLKPEGRISTNWQTLFAIIAGTAVIVGGLISIKADVANAATKAKDAADDAKTALAVARDIREELSRLRWLIGEVPAHVSSPGTKPTTRNNP